MPFVDMPYSKRLSDLDVDLAASVDPRADFADAKKAVRAGLTGGQAGTIRRLL